jgi:hypothetical protein
MDISKAFSAQSLSIYEFFTRESKLGFNIPQYQRPYSWNDENINQLIDDISKRLSESLELGDNEIHFMGTVITIVNHKISKNTKDSDRKSALPSKVEDVIDGQQRLSTISLLACRLYQEIFDISFELPNGSGYDSLKEAAQGYLENLKSVFSYDLQTRGYPTRKPIIIRESEDFWTKDDRKGFTYHSDVSKFLAEFIQHISNGEKGFPWSSKEYLKKNKGNIAVSNLALIQSELEIIFSGNGDDFPTTDEILDCIDQEDFWDFSRNEDYASVKNGEFSELVNRLIRALTFSYFCLKRCCFTSIIPASEVRAFDMFQSLNATGTPLTAIETFKPLVVNSVEKIGIPFSESKEKKHFDEIEDLFKRLKVASTKDQRTSAYLILFDNAYAGNKLGKQFSSQRSTLIKRYRDSQKDGIPNSRFTRKMACTATYFKNIIAPESKVGVRVAEYVSLLSKSNDLMELKREASFCILYLREMKHTLAHAFLVRFYASCQSSGFSEPEVRVFYKACKVLTAFFTLWKSVKQRSYPDAEYRNIIKKYFHWNDHEAIDFDDFKKRLREVFDSSPDLANRSAWLDKASLLIRYDMSKPLCKFALFVSSHDTVFDRENPGLMQVGVQNTTIPYFDPDRWLSPELATIEHIAPEKGEYSTSWDPELYQEESFHELGNLTLLPQKINSSASNKGWPEKYLYYKYMTEQYPHKRPEIEERARNSGIILVESTLKILRECKYSSHILPITELKYHGTWSKDIVEKRSRRMCEILYDRMIQWLSD